MTFGENLKRLRKERNLSIKQLSVLSDIAAGQISTYEHNHYVPHTINIYKLAKALECDYEEFFK